MSLSKHLARQKSVLEAFNEVLEQELRLFGAPEIDGEAITDLAKHKQSLAEELANLEGARVRGQQKLGYPKGLEGASQAARDGQCAHVWQDIITLTHRAKHLNEQVGGLLKIRMEPTEQMLDFLQRVAGGTLYGPDGKSKQGPIGGLDIRA